jgi:hypothetical protein
MKDARAVAAKWRKNTSASVEDYKAGVSAVAEAPGISAARAIPIMIQKLQEAAADGSLERAMRSVSLEEWKASAIAKGAPRISTGVAAAESDMADFLTELLPYVDQVKKSLPARGTREQNRDRMNQNFEAMSKFKRRK